MCLVLPSPGSALALRASFVEVSAEAPLVKLWGLPGERREAYRRLSEELQAHPGPRLSSEPGALAPRELCLVELGGRWHRGQVVACRAPGDYHVFLLDQGRTVRAGAASLARGCRDFFLLPSEVLGCLLADLVPPGGGSCRWPPGALHFLGGLRGRELAGVVREVRAAHGLLVLELPGLLAQMQHLGLAGRITPPAFGALLDTCLAPAAAPPPAPLASSAQAPAAASPPRPDPSGYFYPRLELDVTEPVLVTHVLDPFRVYCQLRSFSKEIQLLSEVLSQSFEASRGRDFQDAWPAVPGSPCAARLVDGCWYRTLLLEVYSEEPAGAVAQVISVDYGKKEFVTQENLRPLPAECFRMPVVTYPCSLKGITDGGTGWAHSQIIQLKMMLLGKVMHAHIETYCPFEHLYYVTLYGENGVNLNSLYGLQVHCLTQGLLQSDQDGTPESVSELQAMAAPEKEESASLQGVLSMLAAATLPVVCLMVGECRRAQVSFLQGPSAFWVRLQEHYQPLCLLKRDLQDFYAQNEEREGILFEPNPGSLCCVLLNENYHRALVIQVQGKSVEVYLVDRGDTEVVNLHKVEELLPRFRVLPAVALRCALANPSPKHLWSPDAIDYFRKATLNKELVIKVVGMQGDIYIVEVYDHSLTGENNLGKIMSQEGYTRHQEGEMQMNFQKMTNELLKKGPYKAVAEEFYSITSNSLSSVMQNHSWTKSDFYCDEKVEVGSTVDVVVSYIENPSLFWCQLAKHSGDLRALMMKIQNDCVHSLQPYDWSSPVCLAKYSGDNKWYRALIVSKENCTESAEVSFVDYGNKECVSLKNIRATKTEFLQLKAQAFRCSLYNLIQPKGQDPFIWDKKATEAFQEFVDSASRIELKCTVFASAALNNTEIFSIVDLITPFESVCQFLTSRNLARPVQPEKSLIPSVQLLSYYYSAHNLKIGSEEVVYVTHVNSPSFFYCQLESSTAALNQLSSSIRKLDRTWHNFRRSQPPGNVYLAKYNDGCWYRAIVTSADATKEIFFVDFGNTELLKSEDLIVVPNDAYELLRLPRLAIKCSLSDVPDAPKDATVWFEKTVLEKPLKALIVAKESDGTLIIELYDGMVQINAKLKQIFSLEGTRVVPNSVNNDLKLSRHPDRRQPDTEVMPTVTDPLKPFPDNKKSCIENQETVSSNKPRFPWGQGRVEAEKTKREVAGKSPRWIDKHESVEDKKGRAFQKTPFQKRERKTDGESHSQSKTNTYFVPKNICDLPPKNIKPGLKSLLYVSHINDPSDFYVQLVEDELLLDSILEKLSRSKIFTSQKEQKLHAGDLISAVFADDGLWYRAVVKEEPSDELVSVQYIDYGNTGVVDICKTGQLLEDCSSFPVMSIHCALHGVKTGSFLEWTEERVLLFSQSTNEVQLVGEFVAKTEGKWEIILSDEKGNITVDLINGNLEKPKSLVVDTESKKEKETLTTNLLEVDLGKNRNSTNSSDAKSFHWKIPKVGETLKIVLVAAKSPGYLWCRLTDADTLDSIERKLQEVEEPEGIDADDIVNGCPCLAVQSKDGTFYRAVVSNIEQSILAVIHVDYGTEALTGIEMVRKIPDELLAIPPQAFLCCPFGFNVEEGSWTESIDMTFCDAIGGSPVEVTILDKKHGPFAVPMFVADLQSLKVKVMEEMKSHWKCSSENWGSTLPSLWRPEEENRDGQGKGLEAVVFETETDSLVSTEDIDASDLLSCSEPLLSVSCCSFDAGKGTAEVFSPCSPTSQTRHKATVGVATTEDLDSAFESFSGEMSCYVPEKKEEQLSPVEGAEMEHPARSKTEVTQQDHIETQVEAESPAKKLTQGIFDTQSISELGIVLSDDTKQMKKGSDMLGMHSSKDALEFETDGKPLFCNEVGEGLELVLYEGLHVQKEQQKNPSLTDKANDLSVDFVTHEVHSWQVDESEVAKPLLDLSAAFTLANAEGQPPFSETESQKFSCTEGPMKVCEGVQSVSKTDCTEWQSLLEYGSGETPMSCDLHEMHNEIGFSGEDYLSNAHLNKGVEVSDHDTDIKGMTFNLTGFKIGSICMVRSGDQWHKAQILGTSPEGTKVLNLTSGNEEMFNPADVWNGMPELESTLTEALNSKTNTLDSLLRNGLEVKEKETTGDLESPCGDLTGSAPE